MRSQAMSWKIRVVRKHNLDTHTCLSHNAHVSLPQDVQPCHGRSQQHNERCLPASDRTPNWKETCSVTTLLFSEVWQPEGRGKRHTRGTPELHEPLRLTLRLRRIVQPTCQAPAGEAGVSGMISFVMPTLAKRPLPHCASNSGRGSKSSFISFPFGSHFSAIAPS